MSAILVMLAFVQAADPARAAADHRRAIACAAREADAAPLDETGTDDIPGAVLRRCADAVARAAAAMAAAIPQADAAIIRSNVEAKVRREAQTRVIARLEDDVPSAPAIEASALRYAAYARLAINRRLEGV